MGRIWKTMVPAVLAIAVPAMATEQVRVIGWSKSGGGRRVQVHNVDGTPVGWFDLSAVDPSLVAGLRALNPERQLIELPGIGWIDGASLNVRYCDHIAAPKVSLPQQGGRRTATQIGSGAPC